MNFLVDRPSITASKFEMSRELWRRAVACAVLVYCLWAVALIMQKPGLHNDEAYEMSAAIHMLHSPQEVAFAHHPNSWVAIFGRSYPLMTLPYIGAVRQYLCLPLFAFFGPSTVGIRLLSMLLGALGILGMSTLISEHVGRTAGAATAWILAMNPPYIGMMAFDNVALSVWMAASGLLSLAVARYLRKPTPAAAFLVGAGMGFALWARANFLWLLAAVFVASLIVLRKRMLLPLSHWAAMAGGGIVGGLPLLVYEIQSKGGTLAVVDRLPAGPSLGLRLSTRLVMLSETFLMDNERRAMWDGPTMPDWQRWLFPAVIFASCLACLLVRRARSRAEIEWARIVSLSFLFLGAMLFLTSMGIAEHHLIVLLPFAVVMTVLASSMVWLRYRGTRMAIAAVAILYIGCTSYWNFSAIQGLRRTGGVGRWSDSLISLGKRLEKEYPSQELQIMDWGLMNNLYIVTNGRLNLQEVFWEATEQQSWMKRPWQEEIRSGGVFLVTGSTLRAFPAPIEGFLQALAETRPVTRRATVLQRNGLPYAQIIDIRPNTLHPGLSSRVITGKERFANQLVGFHDIEGSGWRWTKREFAVILGSPDPQGGTATQLTLELYIPESSLQILGPITLTARVGGHVLAPERYTQAGPHTFTRDLEPAWIGPGPNRIDFALDKCRPPGASEGRELGVVVLKAFLDPR